MSSLLMLSAFFLLAALGPEDCDCGGDDDDDTTTGDDDDTTTGDDDTTTGDDDTTTGDDDTTTGDDDTTPEPFRLEGDVYIIPIYFERDEDGDWVRRELEWTEVDPAGYTYGRVYVGVVADFEDESTPMLHYIAPSAVADPKNDPTPYLFETETWPLETVAVLAIADTWFDNIISPWDSHSYHADMIDTTGTPKLDANIFIDMEFVWNGFAWVPGHHPYGGGDGGGGDDDDDDGGGWGPGDGMPGDPNCPLDLGGDIYLGDSVHVSETGSSLVALYDHNLDGPYWTTLPGSLDGAAQGTPLPWELDVYCSWTANVRGAWDWNNNGMFEPSDDWGATVDGLDNQINPWALAETPILDMQVKVPLDGADIPMPHNYVKVSGVVSTDGSFEFADLPAGTTVGVMAVKVEQCAGNNPSLPQAIAAGCLWNHALIADANQQGDHIPYEVWVQQYSVVYLQTGIDTDGDLVKDTEYPGQQVALHVTDEDEVQNLTISYLP